jgi:ATP-binding cassette subfamily B protein
LNLLMRFYEPGEGRVTLDGVDIREATLESVRGQMGVVFQDSVLFNISILENVRLGNLDASDEEVEEACRTAQIHDVIMSLPDEYDTPVGERGSRLSGGQRQRLAIARAVLRNPTILILDEATSALDSHTEAAINETLSLVGRGRTTVSVTHRLSSVVNAHHIYVLDAGELAQQGTHDELLDRGGLYARLWQEQGGAVGSVDQAREEVSHLAAIPMFADLDAAHLGRLAARLVTERFSAGEEIIREGESGDRLYVVASGEVEVVGRDPLGSERPMAVLREGDYFGEIALLREAPRNATCRARTAVRAHTLAKVDFNALLESVPELREGVEQMITQRLASTARPDSAPVS